VYIHLHGGGYLFGTLSSEDAICSRIVVSRVQNDTPVMVFNVNYRHTPEHGFPTAWNDVEDAFVWVHEHINDIGGLGDQVVVGGISAGAQLTASLTLTQLYGDNERVKTCPKIRGQVLMIPCLVVEDYYAPRKEMLRSPEVSSYVTCAEAPILPVSRINLFMSLLKLSHFENAGRNLRMNPGNATAEEAKYLPPTTFGIAGNDPLRDEGLFFGKLLSENG
jgi:acetyl esterase/lipase